MMSQQPKKRISLKDVAREAGVSTSTVSHVLNKTRYVSAQTVQAVQAAIDSLGYQVNYAARTLRSNRSNCIGIIVPDISNDFFARFVRGAESVLHEQGYTTLLANSNEEAETELQQLGAFMSMQAEGIILAPAQENLPLDGKSLCPMVCFDRALQNIETDTVLADNRQVACSVTERLIQEGHRDLVFVTAMPELYPSRERIAGFRQALQKYGITPDENSVMVTQPNAQAGVEVIQRVLYQTDATAVFVNNQHVTIGILKYLTQKNIKVPERIALVGFDASIWAEVTCPPVSTVQSRSIEYGKTAARLLLERIRNPEKEIEHILFQSDIIWRESTGIR